MMMFLLIFLCFSIWDTYGVVIDVLNLNGVQVAVILCRHLMAIYTERIYGFLFFLVLLRLNLLIFDELLVCEGLKGVRLLSFSLVETLMVHKFLSYCFLHILFLFIILMNVFIVVITNIIGKMDAYIIELLNFVDSL